MIKRVVVSLIALAVATATTVTVVEQSEAQAIPATAVVYTVGDSITAGAALMFPWQSWPERAANRIFGPDHSRMKVVAHGGQCLVATICTGQPLVTTWAGEVLNASPKPTTALVLMGRNDLAHASVTQMINALKQLRSTGTAAGVRVIVGTVLPAEPGYVWWDWTEPDRRALNIKIRAEFGADVFDGAASIGDSLYGWYGSGDGVHPAWPAHVVIGDAVPLGRIA